MEWWRTAVLYEIYIRSFCDSNGDGIGDINGIRGKLAYVKALGVDGVWITPWYPSPMADGGYDVADYRGIDPLFGNLDEAQALIDEAHTEGLKVIIDVVPNHTSEQHPWFQEALAARPGSPARDRFHFRDGQGADGARPPNDWVSAFGGSAWTRTTDHEGKPGQWYLHLFSAQQPDLNWENRAVRDEFIAILTAWFDRGVDGLRIDVASGLAKHHDLPDHGFAEGERFNPVVWEDSPLWDRDEVHQIYREWRELAEAYPGRMFVGEVTVNGADRLARYVRPDELHTTFNLDFLKTPYEASALRANIDDNLAASLAVNAPPTWTLANHDEPRQVTRYGREITDNHSSWPYPPTDLALGTRRARAMALVELALPGSVYLYQGEELGLWEVEDLPDAEIADPVWRNSGGTIRGRDGCRVPLPWCDDTRPFRFTSGRAWLTQPQEWAHLTAEKQQQDPASMWSLYRDALALRSTIEPHATLEWHDLGPQVLAFARGTLQCWLNTSADDLQLPSDAQLILSSAEGFSTDDLTVGHDVAVWWRQGSLPEDALDNSA